MPTDLDIEYQDATSKTNELTVPTKLFPFDFDTETLCRYRGEGNACVEMIPIDEEGEDFLHAEALKTIQLWRKEKKRVLKKPRRAFHAVLGATLLGNAKQPPKFPSYHPSPSVAAGSSKQSFELSNERWSSNHVTFGFTPQTTKTAAVSSAAVNPTNATANLSQHAFGASTSGQVSSAAANLALGNTNAPLRTVCVATPRNRSHHCTQALWTTEV